MIVGILVGLWAICFVIEMGYCYGANQRKYAVISQDDTVYDGIMAIFAGLIAPVSFVSQALVYGFSYGWKMPFTKLTAVEWDKYVTDYDKKLFSDRRPEEAVKVQEVSSDFSDSVDSVKQISE